MLNLIPSLLGTLVFGFTSVSVDSAVKLLTPGLHSAVKTVAIKAASLVASSVAGEFASQYTARKAETIIAIASIDAGGVVDDTTQDSSEPDAA